ncbi:DUF3160 domain-containing protein [bacterium]|nr:DUF3160 domain-containing protein [bacterium]
MRKSILVLIMVTLLLSVPFGMRKAKKGFEPVNLKQIEESFALPQDIRIEGWAIVEGYEPDLEKFYRNLRNRKTPILITSDAVTHIFHVLFDKSLQRKETNEFIPALSELLKSTIRTVEKHEYHSQLSRDGLELLISYLKVSYALLNGPSSIVLNNKEKSELKLITGASGFEESHLFKYNEDYSQYKPRGHYTRTQELKNYFKAMMYMGRMTFLAQNNKVSEAELNRQTAAAIILTVNVVGNTVLNEKWHQIFDPISFLIGRSDDLILIHYDALRFQHPGVNGFNSLSESEIVNFRNGVAKLPAPMIYSGLGDLSAENTAEGEENLKATIGLRFFGQRFVLDSYLFSRLVFPWVDKYEGKSPAPFTLSGGVRGMPRGLDLLNVLGFDYAASVLSLTGDSNYEGYDEMMDKMRKVFSSMKEDEWYSTVYTGWIHTLSALLDNIPKNKKWEKRLARSFLGSWAELRHDTILYVKQSYTMKATSFRPRPGPRKNFLAGFPENNVEFWTRFLKLTDMAGGFFNDDYDMHEKFIILSKMSSRMLEILENKGVLSENDGEYFYKFPDLIGRIFKNIDEKTKKAVLIADVHTDGNSSMVLEEGVGGFSILISVEKAGEKVAFAGPVFNYYEFKMPMDKRLTDEEFEVLLNSGKVEKPEFLN